MTCLDASPRIGQKFLSTRLREPSANSTTSRATFSETQPRKALVARIRAEIINGTYDTEAKIDEVLDRLLALL